MTALALALLLAAAVLHVGWNLLLKGAASRTAVSWWALVCGTVVFLPLLAARPGLPTTIWPLAALSATIEVTYYLLLSYAYARADFSQAYPLARGAAPLLLTVWSALLLREIPSRSGALGIGLIVAGLVLIAGGGLRARGLAAALAVGLCTSVYSLIDGVAVRRADAAAYTVVVLGLTALFLAPIVLVRHGWRATLAEWRGQAGRITAAGALMLLAYILVLRAYTMTPLAYAGAVREVSVVAGALVGWRLLREPFGPRRAAGSVVVFAGVLVLALWSTSCARSASFGQPAAAPAAPVAAPNTAAAPLNTLTADERAAGWRLLFDGSTTAGWRGFRQDSTPSGWQVVDGALTIVASGGHDIITRDTFANFELSLEWKIAPGGNSGIMYRVTEQGAATYTSGPEMQVLDDSGHADGRSRLTAAGSDFGLYPAPAGVVRRAGEWNQARILVNGAHVEHWLNGVTLFEYELWSPDWEQRVQASKFRQWPEYGRAHSGHIALQDHGGADHPAYRNIKIRVLP